MSRPFAVIGFSYLFALLVAAVCGHSIAGYLFAASAAAFGVVIFFHKKIKLTATALGCVALALFSYLFIYNTSVIQAEKLDGQTAEVACIVLDVKNYGTSWAYICKNENAANDSVNSKDKFKFVLRTYTPIMTEPGDKLHGKLLFTSFREEYGLSQKSSYLADGIYMNAAFADGGENSYYTSKSTKITAAVLVSKLSSFLSDKLYRDLPLYSAKLTDAMLLGNTASLKDGIFEQFNLAGVGHILVVSGIHLSVIASFLSLLLSLLKIPRRTVDLCTIAFVILFMAITGFPLTVIRAGAMYIIFRLCSLFGRESDTLNSLGAAVLIICLLNPFSAGDTGFLMSFLATMGIELFSRKIADFINSGFTARPILQKIIRPIAGVLAVSIAASAAVLPLTLLLGKTGSYYSVISSAVLSLPSSIIITLGMMICLFGGAISPLLFLPELLLSLTSRFMLWYVTLFADLPQLILNRLAPIAVICILFIAAFMTIIRKRSRLFKAACISCCLFLILFAGQLESVTAAKNTGILYTQTSTGYSAAVISNNRATVITCDPWGSTGIKSALNEIGCTDIETVITLASVSQIRWSLLANTIGASEISTQEIYGDKYGDRVTVKLLGKTIILDASKNCREPIAADISVEKFTKGDIISGFTIAHESDIIDSVIAGNKLSDISAGKYLFGNSEKAFWIEIDKGGSLRLNSL